MPSKMLGLFEGYYETQSARPKLSKITQLLKSLSTPDYITHAYSKMGIGSLIILQDVFKTDKSYLGKILNDRKNLIKNKNILDLGCGCGFLGILCALNGAKKICFSDINPIDVKNNKLNTILLGIKNALVKKHLKKLKLGARIYSRNF